MKYIKEYNEYGSLTDREVWEDFTQTLKSVKQKNRFIYHLVLPKGGYDDLEDQQRGRGRYKMSWAGDILDIDHVVEFWRKFVLSGKINKEDGIRAMEYAEGERHSGTDGVLTLLEMFGQLERLKEKGGTLYRLVYLKDPSDLRKDKLGNHWTYDKNMFSDFYNEYIQRYDKENTEGSHPYVVTAEIPGGLDLMLPIAFMGGYDRPEEKEIYIPDEDQNKIKLISVDKLTN